LKRAIEIAAGFGVAPAHQRTSSDDIRVRNVRFTPKADIGRAHWDVRFVPILLQKSAVMDSW
jgi:hypothetical protein